MHTLMTEVLLLKNLLKQVCQIKLKNFTARVAPPISLGLRRAAADIMTSAQALVWTVVCWSWKGTVFKSPIVGISFHIFRHLIWSPVAII